MSSPLTVLERRVLAQGWAVEPTKGGHRRWISPDGQVIISTTANNHGRGYRNHLAALRRAGLATEQAPRKMAKLWKPPGLDEAVKVIVASQKQRQTLLPADRLLNILKENPNKRLTVPELAERSGLTIKQVYSASQTLKRRKLKEFSADPKTGYCWGPMIVDRVEPSPPPPPPPPPKIDGPNPAVTQAYLLGDDTFRRNGNGSGTDPKPNSLYRQLDIPQKTIDTAAQAAEWLNNLVKTEVEMAEAGRTGPSEDEDAGIEDLAAWLGPMEVPSMEMADEVAEVLTPTEPVVVETPMPTKTVRLVPAQLPAGTETIMMVVHATDERIILIDEQQRTWFGVLAVPAHPLS